MKFTYWKSSFIRKFPFAHIRRYPATYAYEHVWRLSTGWLKWRFEIQW